MKALTSNLLLKILSGSGAALNDLNRNFIN